ncbi:hypothetical protein GCM10023320_49820 [Pseudonocardia adelaidensis]|uniref:Uncharacterized protein n=1 Tax=Pseudonocardia adelaidensis TaxID=648754 RepID=A0ABP9NUB5_9PSEU
MVGSPQQVNDGFGPDQDQRQHRDAEHDRRCGLPTGDNAHQHQAAQCGRLGQPEPARPVLGATAAHALATQLLQGVVFPNRRTQHELRNAELPRQLCVGPRTIADGPMDSAGDAGEVRHPDEHRRARRHGPQLRPELVASDRLVGAPIEHPDVRRLVRAAQLQLVHVIRIHPVEYAQDESLGELLVPRAEHRPDPVGEVADVSRRDTPLSFDRALRPVQLPCGGEQQQPLRLNPELEQRHRLLVPDPHRDRRGTRSTATGHGLLGCRVG